MKLPVQLQILTPWFVGLLLLPNPGCASSPGSTSMVLARQGAPQRSTVVSAIVPFLEDAEPRTRALAAQLLARLGPEAAEAVPGLQQLLGDESPLVRNEALRALSCCGGAAVGALPAVAKWMTDPGSGAEASQTMVALAPFSVPLLVEALERTDSRREAARALASIEPLSRDVVGALSRALEDYRPDVRTHVIHALSHVTDAGVAMPWLVKSLEDSNRSVRREAEAAIARSVPAFLFLLDSGDNEHRQLARSIPWQFRGPVSGTSEELLTHLLYGKDPVIRRLAAEALTLCTDLTTADVALWMRDEDPRVRQHSRTYLEHRGRAAADAIPLVVEATRSDPSMLAILHAIVQPDPALLEGLLDSPSFLDRRCALLLLHEVAPGSPALQLALPRLKDDPEPRVREVALKILGLGGAGAGAEAGPTP